MASRPGAEAVLRALLAAGLLDASRRSRTLGEEVLVPARADAGLAALAERLGVRVVEDEAPLARRPRRTPREEVVDVLRPLLPEALLEEVPDKWELLGDVLVLRVPEALAERKRELAAAFAGALGAKTVLEDKGGVAGEYREMRAEPLVGDDPVATHVENGVTFRLDASRLMFSSGNVAERARAASLPAQGEVVVDMFAGVGYFTLPLAVHARPRRVVALEKNPVAYRYLVENVALNGVEDVVECWCGDNREYPVEGLADRVLMGYFPGTGAFLPKAFRLLRPAGGVVHYHDTAHAERWKEEMTRRVLDAARACGRVVAIEEARVVKSHSPGVVHAVLAARVRQGAPAPQERAADGQGA